MNEIVNSFLLVYAGLFPIVNPLGAAPIFLTLTRHRTAERPALAWRVARNGFLLLLGSLILGSYVLEFFGITLPVVRIAGGLVVTSLAWKLLNEGDAPEERQPADASARRTATDDSFYPLTMPLTVGPGSIAVAITLGSQRPKVPASLAHLAILGAAAIAGLLAIAATIYLSFRFGERLVTAIGESGANVLARLSAFVLLCIGIGIIWSGVSGLLGIASP